MKSLKELTGSGRLEQLTALRDKLASAIDDCESKRDLAALSRQYRDVLKEIEELTMFNKETEVDRILSEKC